MSLKTEGLQFAYNATNQFSFSDIQCEKGKHLIITGASGSGKTTLLHLLAGMLRPSKGSICIDNVCINELSDAKMDRFRGKRIGIVFQKSHFVQALNVMENLMLSVWLSEKKNQKERALELLSRLGLIEKSKEKVYALSAGQQQRLSIARALINNAGLILADEPTSSLDDLNCEKVIELLINEANQTGASLIVVTHDQRIKPFFENKYFLQ